MTLIIWKGQASSVLKSTHRYIQICRRAPRLWRWFSSLQPTKHFGEVVAPPELIAPILDRWKIEDPERGNLLLTAVTERE